MMLVVGMVMDLVNLSRHHMTRSAGYMKEP
jgi:hypothetical protein